VVPQTASRTISFSVNDGTKSSVGSSKVIVVQATHQTPLVGASGNSVDYLTGQAATAIDSGITLTDRNVSGSTLVPMSITVQITAGLQSGDTLGISVPPSTLTNGMNVNYDAASGTRRSARPAAPSRNGRRCSTACSSRPAPTPRSARAPSASSSTTA
jgi:hypothetical protein